MNVEDALDTIHQAHMVAKALSMLERRDLDEPCFEVLCRQSLLQMSRSLEEAHAILCARFEEHVPNPETTSPKDAT